MYLDETRIENVLEGQFKPVSSLLHAGLGHLRPQEKPVDTWSRLLLEPWEISSLYESAR